MDNKKYIGVASVLLTKQSPYVLSSTHSLHYCENVKDKDTMRGIAVESALKLKPGYSIVDVVVDIIEIDN